jgi:putative membrane protein
MVRGHVLRRAATGRCEDNSREEAVTGAMDVLPKQRSEQPKSNRAEHIRDHLANERTLLSWIRLALSLSALGFVIARFGIFLEQLVASGQLREATPHYSVPIGVALVLLGPVLAALAARRFFATEREIAEESAEPHYSVLYLMLGVVGVVGLALAVYLIYVWLAFGSG